MRFPPFESLACSWPRWAFASGVRLLVVRRLSEGSCYQLAKQQIDKCCQFVTKTDLFEKRHVV